MRAASQSVICQQRLIAVRAMVLVLSSPMVHLITPVRPAIARGQGVTTLARQKEYMR